MVKSYQNTRLGPAVGFDIRMFVQETLNCIQTMTFILRSMKSIMPEEEFSNRLFSSTSDLCHSGNALLYFDGHKTLVKMKVVSSKVTV